MLALLAKIVVLALRSREQRRKPDHSDEGRGTDLRKELK